MNAGGRNAENGAQRAARGIARPPSLMHTMLSADARKALAKVALFLLGLPTLLLMPLLDGASLAPVVLFSIELLEAAALARALRLRPRSPIVAARVEAGRAVALRFRLAWWSARAGRVRGAALVALVSPCPVPIAAV